jgi:hypothetical protein
MGIPPLSDERGGQTVPDPKAPTIEPGEIDLREDGGPVQVRIRITDAGRRWVRITSPAAWVRIEPGEIEASSEGGTVEVGIDVGRITPMDRLAPTLSTILQVQLKVARVLDGASPPPSATAAVRLALTSVEARGSSVQPPITEEEGEALSVAPSVGCLVVPSLQTLEFVNVPPDGAQRRKLVLTWVQGEPGIVTITGCPEWLVVRPAAVDFREGRRDRTVECEVLGRMLPAASGLETQVYLDAQSASGSGESRIVIRAIREVEDSVEGRVRRSRAVSSWAFAGAYVIYLLFLILRAGLPMHGIGLAAIVPAALGIGIFTYRRSGESHALWALVIVAVAALVLGGVLGPNFLRSAVLVIVPAAGIPVLWLSGGLLFRKHPTSIALVALLPLGIALVVSALLAVLMPASELPHRGPSALDTHGQMASIPPTRGVVGESPPAAQDPPQAGSTTVATPQTRSDPAKVSTSAPAQVAPQNARPEIPDELGALRKYVRLHGTDVPALNKLARMEGAVGKAERAVELYRKSLLLNPDQANVKQELIRLERSLGGGR